MQQFREWLEEDKFDFLLEKYQNNACIEIQ